MRGIPMACALLLVAAAGQADAQTVPAAQASLEDTRRPLPLLPMMADHQKENMRGNLVAVQEITAALGTDDFAAIEKAATRIGYSGEMRQMCENMGAAAPGFTAQALAFHKSVNLIADAARAHDRPGVLKTLNDTLRRCTACHATWKQQLIDEDTWVKLTATPLHPGSGHHDHR